MFWPVVVSLIAVANQPDLPVLSVVQLTNTLSEFEPRVSSHQDAISHFPVQVTEGSWRPGAIVPGMVLRVSQAKLLPSNVPCWTCSRFEPPTSSAPAWTQISVLFEPGWV